MLRIVKYISERSEVQAMAALVTKRLQHTYADWQSRSIDSQKRGLSSYDGIECVCSAHLHLGAPLSSSHMLHSLRNEHITQNASFEKFKRCSRIRLQEAIQGALVSLLFVSSDQFEWGFQVCKVKWRVCYWTYVVWKCSSDQFLNRKCSQFNVTCFGNPAKCINLLKCARSNDDFAIRQM